MAPSRSMTCSRRAPARLLERRNLVMPISISSGFDLVRRSGDAEMISVSNFMKPISSGVPPNGGGAPMLRRALMYCTRPSAGWPCVDIIFTPMEASGQYLALMNAGASNINRPWRRSWPCTIKIRFCCPRILAPLAKSNSSPSSTLVDEPRPTVCLPANHSWRFCDHRFCFVGFRNRTPGPPPFSSMNSSLRHFYRV